MIIKITIQAVDDDGKVHHSEEGTAELNHAMGSLQQWFAETFIKVKMATIFNKGKGVT